MKPVTRKTDFTTMWQTAINRIIDFMWIKDEPEQYLNYEPECPVLEWVGSIALMVIMFAGVVLWWAMAAGVG